MSYLDMHGRTIATALAGRSPRQLDSLVSNKTYYIEKKLLDSNSNIVKGWVIESTKGLTVTRGDYHQFKYSLLPDSISITDCKDTTICYDCIYDLKITIVDECNDTSRLGGKPIVITQSNYQLSTLCDTISRLKAIDTTFNLAEGTYLITKTLSINRKAMDWYRDSVFMVRNTCRTFEQSVETQMALLRINTQCQPVCDSCKVATGSWDTFRNRYMQDAGISSTDSVNFVSQARIAFNDAIRECSKLCEDTPLHQSIREKMLADVTPPLGQYANPDSVDHFSVFWSTEIQEPAWKTVTGEYLSDEGKEMAEVKWYSQAQFVGEFKSWWAETLLPKHPEYPKLKKFEELAQSNLWDNRFESVHTYQAAVDSGFLNPANFSSHPAGSIFNYNSAHRDPLFTDLMPSYKQAMEDSVVAKAKDTSGNAISMWALAIIMAHCPEKSTTCLYQYKSNDSAFSIGAGCSADRDMAWRYFREMYLQEKREIVAQILKAAQQAEGGPFADLTELRDNHAPNFYDLSMLPSEAMPTSEAAGRDSLSKFIDDNCKSYVNLWWQELGPCGFNSTDSSKLIPRLIEICRQGGDSLHVFGSSTVKPSSTYHFTSFEQLIKHYCDSTGKVYNSNCNVYLISAPLPYDQQPVYAAKPVVQKPDSCECATIAGLYQGYQNNGVDSSFSDYVYRTSRTRIRQGVLDTLRMACNGSISCSFLAEPIYLPPVLQCGVKDICVGCARIDSLYNRYLAKFPDAAPAAGSEDSTQTANNRLFERYMNTNLGFAKTTDEYLAFKTSCANYGTTIGSLPATTLNSYLTEYGRYRGVPHLDPSGVDTTHWKVNYSGSYYKMGLPLGDMIQNGKMSYPGYYADTMRKGSGWDYLNDTLCLDSAGFTWEARIRIPDSLVINPSYDATCWFWLYTDSANGSGTLLMALSKTDGAGAAVCTHNNDGRKACALENVPGQHFNEWRTVRFKFRGRDFKYYVDTNLLAQRTLDKPFTRLNAASITLYSNYLELDYIRIYDTAGNIFYNENFEDPYNLETYRNLGQCSSCAERFANYFNKKNSSNYSYSSIDSIYYASNGVHLNVCEPSPLKLCGKVEPVFLPAVITQRTSCADSTLFAHSTATVLYDAYRDSLINSFNDRYLAKCLKARYRESFTVYKPVNEHHYTLYYYDQAGNLEKTIPPAGVDVSKFGWAVAWGDSVKAARLNRQVLTPNHSLPTQYRYNTLNQVVKQQSPDGGQIEFWYDRLGRLAISQNARQKPSNLYSYNQYDSLGRITEVGQVNGTGQSAMSDAISRSQSNLQTWLTTLYNKRGQMTTTVYDMAYEGFDGYADMRQLIEQKNLRNRVSYITITDTLNTGMYNQGTFYSYDILGNVDYLLHDYGGSGNSTTANLMNKLQHRWKKTGYKYDLISGKVNMVMYQQGFKDGFFHRYSYDAENRLTLVETSVDSLVWEKEARYEYYRHGPLARLTLGEQQVQGLDYAYTLQGWLKGVNSTGGTDTFDMGGDGLYSSLNRYTAKDAIGLTLNYFGNDYTALNGHPFPGSSGHLTTDAYRPMFNGNISSSSVYQKKFDYYNSPGGPLIFYNYKYDQLNRLTGQDAHTLVFNTGNGYIDSLPVMGQKLKERISYDANGNIQKYLRNSVLASVAMDSLSYSYYPGSNKLSRITDTVSPNMYVHADGFITDIDSQSDSNYIYDAIGNLIADKKENITDIKWNVYGKIQEITKDVAGDITTIKYTYDAAGNRISQVVIASMDDPKYTWYVRDAKGNLLSTYTGEGDIYDEENRRFNQADQFLYGSSRLGSMARNEPYDEGPDAMDNYRGEKGSTRGDRQYELTNHLGNVLATISDRKFAVPFPSSSLIKYYEPHIVTAQDYYPFGMLSRVELPNGNKTYNFGFNGKMNDNEVKGLGNQQDYGMRVYDPRVGRFLSVDPITRQYPELTPYQFASNTPIQAIDVDGLEGMQYIPAYLNLKWKEFKGWWNTPTQDARSLSEGYQLVMGMHPVADEHTTNGTAVLWAFAAGAEAYGNSFYNGGRPRLSNDLPATARKTPQTLTKGMEEAPVLTTPTTTTNTANGTGRQIISASGNNEAVQSNTATQPNLTVGTHKATRAAFVNTGTSSDHIPSFASLVLGVETKLGRPLDKTEKNNLFSNSLTLVVPTTLHQSTSQTYGGRNNKAMQQADAINPIRAIHNNVNAYRQTLLNQGYTNQQVDQAIQRLVVPFQSANLNGTGSSSGSSTTTSANNH